MTQKCVLVVGKFDKDEYWFSVLVDALRDYGAISIISGEEEMQDLTETQYKSSLVIIDSGSVGCLTDVISSVRELMYEAKIMVMSAAPTWKESRQARYAGAGEYCPKSLDKNEILERVEGLIGMP